MHSKKNRRLGTCVFVAIVALFLCYGLPKMLVACTDAHVRYFTDIIRGVAIEEMPKNPMCFYASYNSTNAKSCCTVAYANNTEKISIDDYKKENDNGIKVIFFAPNSDSRNSAISQIVIQFNKNIAHLINDTALLPITITPHASCKWTWVSSNTVACNIAHGTLKDATKYTVVVHGPIPGTAMALDNHYVYTFAHNRLVMEYANIRSWAAPNTPEFQVLFNQPVKLHSLRDHVYFVNRRISDGIKVNADVKEIWGKEMEASGQVRFVLWNIRPASDLAYNTDYKLVIEPGVQPLVGDAILNDVEDSQSLSFTTYPKNPTLDRILCMDSNYQQICVQDKKQQKNKTRCAVFGAVEVLFSTPVNLASARCFLGIIPDPDEKVRHDACTLYDRQQKIARVGGGYKMEEVPQYGTRLVIRGFKPNTNYAIGTKNMDFTAKSFKESVWVYKTMKKLFSKQQPSQYSMIRDKFGNYVLDSETLYFSTSNLDPALYIDKKYTTLFAHLDNDMQVRTLNVRELSLAYNKFDHNGAVNHLSYKYSLQFNLNQSVMTPLKMRTILNGQTGFISAALHPLPNVVRGTERFFVGITPFNVVAKVGYFNTKIWVTDLKTGKSIENASVKLSYGSIVDLSYNYTVDVGNTDSDGIVVLHGTKKIDPDVTKLSGDETKCFIVTITKGDDVAVLPIVSEFATNMYQVSDKSNFFAQKKKYDNLTVLGLTPQKIYRPGDLVQYKIYVRDLDNTGVILPDSGLRYDFFVQDSQDNTIYSVHGVKLSKYGTYDGQFYVSKDVVLGKCLFTLKAVDREKNTVFLSSFTDIFISSFEPPSMKIETNIMPIARKVSKNYTRQYYTSNDTINATTKVTSYSGSSYADTDVRITATIKSSSFIFDEKYGDELYKDGDQYHTRGNKIKQSVISTFYFSSYDEISDDRMPAARNTEVDAAEVMLFNTVTRTNHDGMGSAQFKFDNVDKAKYDKIYRGTISVEGMVLQDVHQVSVAYAPYSKVDMFVGLRSLQNGKFGSQSSIYSVGKAFVVEEVVVDHNGIQIDGIPIVTTLEKKVVEVQEISDTSSLAVHSYNTKWVGIVNFHNKSSASEFARCVFVTKEAGEYRVVATIKDSQGRQHRSVLHNVFIVGNDYVQWHRKSDNIVEIFQEKAEYQVGDTARYFVKNSTPGAIAFVTVERDGVLENLTRKLNNSTEVIDVPIKDSYYPHFFFSITVFTPLDADYEGDRYCDTDLQQTHKPLVLSDDAIKYADVGCNKRSNFEQATVATGYVKTLVLSPLKDIDIVVNTTKSQYKPGEECSVVIDSKVRGKVLSNIISSHDDRDSQLHNGEGSELTVFVVDKAIYDMYALRNSTLHNPIDLIKFMQRSNNIGVNTFSLINSMDGTNCSNAIASSVEQNSASITLQNASGCNSHYMCQNIISNESVTSINMRVRKNHQDKFIAYWNPKVVMDNNGHAEIKFMLPDQLTEWKVVVIANKDADMFGSATTTFRTSKDIEIFAFLPKEVNDGEQFNARFEIVNNSKNKYDSVIFAVDEVDLMGQKISWKRDLANIMPHDRMTVSIPVATFRHFLLQKHDDPTSVQEYVPQSEPMDSSAVNELKVTALVNAMKEGGTSITDALQSTVLVRAIYNTEITTQFGVIRAHPLMGKITIPSDILETLSKITVSASLSVVGDLGHVIKLVARQTDYDCWEQQISQALVAAYYMKLFTKAYNTTFLWDNAENVIRRAISNIVRYQQQNGGILYKPLSPNSPQIPDPYLSAYTMLLLERLKGFGYDVDTERLDALSKYLRNTLYCSGLKVCGDRMVAQHECSEMLKGVDISDTVSLVTLYALAVQDPLSRERKLCRYGELLNNVNIKNLSLIGKAYYLNTLLLYTKQCELQIQLQQAKTVLESILGSAIYTPGKVWFADKGGITLALHSELLTNCVILSTLSMIGGSNDSKYIGLRRLVNDIPVRLMRVITEEIHSSKHMSYGNTHENALCLMAIADYVAAYEGGKVHPSALRVKLGDVEKSIILDDKISTIKSITYDIKKNDLSRDMQIKLDAEAVFSRTTPVASSIRDYELMGKSAQNFNVKRTVDTKVKRIIDSKHDTTNRFVPQQLYYNIKLDYVRKNLPISYMNNGIEVRKEYSVWKKDRWILLNKVREDGNPIGFSVRMGDLVRVDLYVMTPMQRYFMIIDDPIAGAFGMLNPVFSTTSLLDFNTLNTPLSRESFMTSYRALPLADMKDTWISAIDNNCGQADGIARVQNAEGSVVNCMLQSRIFTINTTNKNISFFAQRLERGNYHFSYLLYVTTSGRFYILPTVAMELYNRHINGQGISGMVDVEDSVSGGADFVKIN